MNSIIGRCKHRLYRCLLEFRSSLHHRNINTSGILNRMASVPWIVPTDRMPSLEEIEQCIGCPNSDQIELSIGFPCVSMLDRSARVLDKVATASKSQPPTQLMQCGPVNGDGLYRKILAEFLTRQYQSVVLADELYVTSGASFGLIMLSSALFDAGDMVFVEDPTYYLAFEMLRMWKLNITSVPTDEQGIIPAALQEAVTVHIAKNASRPLTDDKPYRGLVYLVSTFHNPTGRCLSDERCKQIIDVARKHKLLIICDDVYNLYYFTEKPPERLYSYDTRTDPDYMGSVVSNGSFSKVLPPGIRLGWLEAPHKLLRLLAYNGLALRGRRRTQAILGIMGAALESGQLDEIVVESRLSVKSQMETMLETLAAELPREVHISKPLGGFFLWICLPEYMSAQAILDECLKKDKINFQVGNSFSLNDNFKNCFRISYSLYKADVLKLAAKKIAAVIQNHLKRCMY